MRLSVGPTDFADHAFCDFSINSWAYICTLPHHRREGAEQLSFRIRLQKITSCACAKGCPHQIRRFVKSQQNDLHFRLSLTNREGRLDAIQPRHSHIHDDDFWPQLAGQSDGILSIIRFSAKLPLRECM